MPLHPSHHQATSHAQPRCRADDNEAVRPEVKLLPSALTRLPSNSDIVIPIYELPTAVLATVSTAPPQTLSEMPLKNTMGSFMPISLRGIKKEFA
jgi:hypothetical protein